MIVHALIYSPDFEKHQDLSKIIVVARQEVSIGSIISSLRFERMSAKFGVTPTRGAEALPEGCEFL